MNSNIFEILRNLITEHFGVPTDKIMENSNFADDLGADSLDKIEFTMIIEEHFGIDVSDCELYAMKTISDVIRYIESHNEYRKVA